MIVIPVTLKNARHCKSGDERLGNWSIARLGRTVPRCVKIPSSSEFRLVKEYVQDAALGRIRGNNNLRYAFIALRTRGEHGMCSITDGREDAIPWSITDGLKEAVKKTDVRSAPGSPIFKAVQKKWCTAWCRALKQSPKPPESAVGEGSEPSYVAWSGGAPG
jgi:hypothetical protein